ncbi:rod-binding protein [Limnohabitans sp.]|uniref:rod-binding protein n=1 Tax=Limnohabitans sp. TaxID=1907725 RepID=UPI0025BD6690|nr:rod-binding protein [Limnohabitans sp.]
MNDINASGSYLDFNALTQLKGDAARDPSKAVRKTAEQFEAYFIQQMMKTMRDSIEKSDLVEGGNMEMYQDLMDKEVSLSMAKRGGMGLADMMERQMNQAQAMSTQDALRQRQPMSLSAPALPLNPTREPMQLKPAAVEAYRLERPSGFKLGDKP